MNREIVTSVIGADLVRAELSFFARHFQESGQKTCGVLFGFAWGNDYYPGNEWDHVNIPLAKLVEEVERVESLGWGRVGADDLFVTLDELAVELRFCHEADLHLTFQAGAELGEFYFERWSALGFKPSEWEVFHVGKLGAKIR